MSRGFRFASVSTIFTSAWLLSGCVAPPAQVAVPTQRLPADACNLPTQVSGETIESVIYPGQQPVGCINPRFRLVHGGDRAAEDLFNRLTVGFMDAPLDASTTMYGAPNFLTAMRYQSGGMAVGWRHSVLCRRPLVWIFRWPGEFHKMPGVKPVLLEFIDEPNAENCPPNQKRDADGGGP